MPHLVIPYTANLEPHTDMTALCRTMADSQRDYAFADLHVRMAPGRSEAVKQRVGDGLLATACWRRPRPTSRTCSSNVCSA
jgi:5-carboxymethyl-2-hydroxymuconate isomerase